MIPERSRKLALERMADCAPGRPPVPEHADL